MQLFRWSFLSLRDYSWDQISPHNPRIFFFYQIVNFIHTTYATRQGTPFSEIDGDATCSFFTGGAATKLNTIAAADYTTIKRDIAKYSLAVNSATSLHLSVYPAVSLSPMDTRPCQAFYVLVDGAVWRNVQGAD